MRLSPLPGSEMDMPAVVSVITIFENVQLRIVPSFIQPMRIPPEWLVKLQFVTVTRSQTLFSLSDELFARTIRLSSPQTTVLFDTVTFLLELICMPSLFG